MGEMSVLLIEDNSAVSETLALALSKNYNFFSASTGQLGLSIASEISPDIIILDLNLPDISGLTVCERLRKIGVRTPILVLSGDNSLATKLELFAAGADDYLVKPFSLGELRARLKVIDKRIVSYRSALSNYKTASLVLDRDSRTVAREGGPAIALRRKEFAVLEYLIKNVGKIVSRDHLAADVWNKPAESWSNTVDVHIKHLRDKIDKPYDRPLITTVHGHGYRLEVY